ncbi:MauE/DoxX family redox-associated membrane protein [Achromobacter pestifer]
MNDPVLLYGASAALTCVLLLGALEKLKDIAGFSRAVAAYDILPSGWGGAFAWGYALAEITAGVLLLMPSGQASGALLALLVLMVATMGLAFNLARGHRDIDCGCGGPASRGPASQGRDGAHGGGLSWWLVARNAVLALWTAPALVAAAGQSRSLQWADAAAVFGLAMTAVGLYFTANHLLASHLKLRNL